MKVANQEALYDLALIREFADHGIKKFEEMTEEQLIFHVKNIKLFASQLLEKLEQ